MDLSCLPFLPLLFFLKDRRRGRRVGYRVEKADGEGEKKEKQEREEEGRPADSQAPAFCF